MDPGPADDAHLDAVVRAAGGGSTASCSPTRTSDHAEGAAASPSAQGAAVVLPGDGDEVGPFKSLATPGHSPDHVSLLLGRILFTGDTVLGSGSVFISPGEGSLSAYLDSLRRLRALDLEVLFPDTGRSCGTPRPSSTSTSTTGSSASGCSSRRWPTGRAPRTKLLDRAWADAPAPLRPAAALTLRAHLGKLAEERHLPADLDWIRE